MYLGGKVEYSFFATVSRMKYIERWALMRSTIPENLSEHCLEVSMIAHALCIIGNVRYGKALDADKAAVIGLYHDASEIITGDMPTPVKYHNKVLKDAYKSIESEANERLLLNLPKDLQGAYRDILFKNENERYEWKLVKAADKLSALIKCIEEEKTGNREFVKAKESTEKSIRDMSAEIPEINDFMDEFLPAYYKTLDELN
jgi:5'-deoxynucleotidase